MEGGHHKQSDKAHGLPSHVIIRGNGMVDEAATDALNSDTSPIP